MKINKIYVVAALHGDEPFGLKVLADLRQVADNRVIRQVGHPEAVAKRKEFLEANLNRSFGPDAPASKEKAIAKHILRDIEAHKPDLIIDIHTCECSVGKSAIIVKLDQNLIEIAKCLGMDYVVEGEPSVMKQTLIGQYPKKSILLEFGTGLRSDRLSQSIAGKISALLDEALVPRTQVKIYSKTRCISKAECEGLEMNNYIFDKQLKGYPYLVGKNTYPRYTDYVGFLAEQEETL